MKLVYGLPSGGGWHPVTHMVRLLAELLPAELVLVPTTRPANALRRLASLAPRRRGAETCLVVAARASLLYAFLEPGSWLRGYGHLAGWVIDSFWVDNIPTSLQRRGHFDQLFVTGEEDVEPWATATGCPMTWLPWGSDVLRLGSDNADRPVDLQRVGRQPPGWEDDYETRRAFEAAGLRFEGRPPMHDDATANQIALMEQFSRAKFTLSFSNAVSPASYTHPSRQYLTGRWTDALAGGASVAGVVPECAATRRLLWPGAVLDLETVERSRGIARIAEAVSEWNPAVARENYLQALERLDWRWRFAELARALNVESNVLDDELDTLRQKLQRSPSDS